MLVPPQNPYIIIMGYPIYYYGIILAISIFIGVCVSERVAFKYYFKPNIIFNIATPVILSGIVCARLYYCLLDFHRYINNPLEILALREGGLSIHGAIIGGALAIYYQSKKQGINFFKLCDIISIGLPLAQSTGRWGNFFNSEAFGIPTNLAWSVYIKQPLRPEKYYYNETFHPTFLYESICDFIIFWILYKYVLKNYKNSTGTICALYLIMYSIVRFIIELLRVDCICFINGIALPQIASVIMFCLGISILIYRKKVSNKND